MSKIEWTEKTVNSIVGCTKCSPGCEHCYAERMACRLAGIESTKHIYGPVITNGKWNGKIVCNEEPLKKMAQRKKPTIIFHNSMGDTFHEKAEWDIIKAIFMYIEQSPQHTHLILTKRINNALRDSRRFDWERYSMHFWLGVTVCNQDELWKLDILREIPAKKKFVSFEPLLTAVKPDLTGIDWVIVGGESGPNRRHVPIEYFKALKNQCVSVGIPFFFKQFSIANIVQKMPKLDGKIWNQTPKIN